MNDKSLRKFSGLIGIALLATFTLGLAHSIATGFAGFFGGLPVFVIVLLVLAMAVYDYWDECWRAKD
jgi:sterol desaturase/sphingolipid hydroxylase (fatty acid hydroxylase superfamily)